jgi:hypothetical protein
MERHFPGGPTMDPTPMEPGDVRYLGAHAERSSVIVTSWLSDQGAPPELVTTVGDLVRRHEIGGRRPRTSSRRPTRSPFWRPNAA